jgi:hypothetical protein
MGVKPASRRPVAGAAANPTPPVRRSRASYGLPLFPAAKKVAGSVLLLRHELESWKRALVGLPPEPIPPSAPICFVTIAQAARELSVSKTTIKRRLNERRLADEGAAAAAAAAVVAKRAPAKRRLEPVGGG